jgi:hypothetical protein
MWASIAGSFAMALGVAVATQGKGRKTWSKNLQGPVGITTPATNIVLFSLIVPTIIASIAVGSYYVRFDLQDNPYAFEVTKPYNNYLTYTRQLALVGLFYQVIRYTQTHRLVDAMLALVMVVLQVALFLPTGTRGAAYGFVPYLFVVYSLFEKSRKKIALGLMTGIIVFSILTFATGVYRAQYLHAGSGDMSLTERLSVIGKYAVQSEDGADAGPNMLSTIAHRMSAYRTVGRIIDWTPDTRPYRGEEGLMNFWMVLLPNSIFPNRPDAGMSGSSALTAEYYGVGNPSKGLGSSPVMLLGELYSRWSWWGIALGMFLYGIGLALIDRLFLSSWNSQALVFFVLGVPKIVGSLGGTVLTVVICIREIVFVWVVSIIIGKILDRHFVAK